MLEVRLLGQFNLRRDDQPIEVQSRPAQSLLAYLILSAGTSHRREKLAGLFWPDAPETSARSNLRHALWRLRKSLDLKPQTGQDFLLSDDLSVAFDASADYWLDVATLAREVSHDASEADRLIEAVAVYGGELLPGFYDEWVVLEREHVRAVFERKMQRLLTCLVDARRWPEALQWGERWIALGHVPEPAYRAMMHAHAGLGDLAGVATVYRRCTETLARELGVEPSEQTRDTYQWLSNGGEPGTLAPARPAAEESDRGVAITALLKRWRQQHVEALDLASLALVHAHGAGLVFDSEDAELLLRSALQHGLDLEPWVRRIGPGPGVVALRQILQTYPKPPIRLKIVEALSGLADWEAGEALLSIAATDDAAVVRSRAAVAAARDGHLEAVTTALLGDLRAGRDPAAFEALVAVADEVGLPRDIGPYPRVGVGLALAQRRWRARRDLLARQAALAGLGGGAALALYGAGAPLYSALAEPETFRETLAIVTVPAWVVSGIVAGLVVGSLQGLLSGVLVGVADALGSHDRAWRWRLLLGCGAGLFYAAYLITFAAAGLLGPEAPPAIYVPVNILYGLFVGLALSLAIPPLLGAATLRQQVARCARGALVLLVATIPYVYLVYREKAEVSLLSRLLVALVLPCGVGLALTRRPARASAERR